MAFRKDYDYGVKKQLEVLPLLVSYFGDNIKPTTGRLDPWDYVGDTCVYELKSRNNSYAQYPTTMIGFDKIKTQSKDIIFIFNFTDGLYWIKYDEPVFKSFETKDFGRYRPGVKDKVKPYVYIPIQNLIKI